jgi:sporulation protein YlmC with PRC-barrel domain
VIRFSDIDGNPVMNTASALTVGRVGALVVDPQARRVVALGVKKSKGPGDTLLWDGIKSIGPDAVTVDSDQRLAEPPKELEDRLALDVRLIGHRVLDDHGHELGRVRDVEFDPSNGSVVTLMLKDAYVDGDRLLGIGSYAVVVRAVSVG